MSFEEPVTADLQNNMRSMIASQSRVDSRGFESKYHKRD